ncbi:TnsA-like heteromeric transposase endonuclease subunit [Streptomyces griseorubiginosus]|uniref:TnsA-like heteromeric transposase endonuclease subunit n=1 Tax=Streptomyces griseorubiginosus TaxID=67304 RepID=UPI003F53D325
MTVAFEDLPPVSAFPVIPGRRWGPGLWWSATTGRHVTAGSNAMRAQLMVLDRDPAVTGLAGRPVRLLWRNPCGQVRSWVPQLFARRADGTALLADCPSHPDAGGERARKAAEAIAQACTHRLDLPAPDTARLCPGRQPEMAGRLPPPPQRRLPGPDGGGHRGVHAAAAADRGHESNRRPDRSPPVRLPRPVARTADGRPRHAPCTNASPSAPEAGAAPRGKMPGERAAQCPAGREGRCSRPLPRREAASGRPFRAGHPPRRPGRRR